MMFTGPSVQKKSIKHILMKHEANAGVAADVYGRLTGEPGIVLTIAGPGAKTVLLP